MGALWALRVGSVLAIVLAGAVALALAVSMRRALSLGLGMSLGLGLALFQRIAVPHRVTRPAVPRVAVRRVPHRLKQGDRVARGLGPVQVLLQGGTVPAIVGFARRAAR